MIELKNGMLKMDGNGQELFEDIGAIVRHFRQAYARSHDSEEVKEFTNTLINYVEWTLTDKEEPEPIPENLPIGYVVKKEPKTNRRSFALQQSILTALKEIAEENGTNINALVNDILLDYVNDHLERRTKEC